MNILPKSLLIATVLVAGLAPAHAAKIKRADAVELCSTRVSEELGEGKIKVLRAKQKRGSFAIRLLKMAEDGRTKHAYVDCSVEKDGSVSVFETDIRI